jgi:hypothetical protein
MKAVSSTVGVKVPADATVTADVGIGPRSEAVWSRCCAGCVAAGRRSC